MGWCTGRLRGEGAQHPKTQDTYSLECVGSASDLLTWPENFFYVAHCSVLGQNKREFESVYGGVYVVSIYYIKSSDRLNKSIVNLCW